SLAPTRLEWPLARVAQGGPPMAYPSLGSPDVYGNYGQPAGSKLPWFLLVLVLGGVGYGGYLGLKERGRLMDQASAATVAAAKTEALKQPGEGKLAGLEGGETEGGGVRDALGEWLGVKAWQ